MGVHLDSFILLGKLHYAEFAFEEALKYYERANIDCLEEKQLPPRSLKIMAEAFAIKVNCILQKFLTTNYEITVLVLSLRMKDVAPVHKKGVKGNPYPSTRP